MVDAKEVTFKVDTGAEVTVIAENILTQLDLKKLRKSSKTLCGQVSPGRAIIITIIQESHVFN